MNNIGDGSTALDANEICKECGICCDGVLFTHATISQSEAVVLRSLGVESQKNSKNKNFFELPCSGFRDGGCSLYQSRPVRCSAYSCALQLKVMNGSIPMADAQKIISIVKTSRLWIESSINSVMNKPTKDGNFRTLIQNYYKAAAKANEQGKLSPSDKKRIKKIFEHVKLVDRFFENTSLLKKYAGLIQSF